MPKISGLALALAAPVAALLTSGGLVDPRIMLQRVLRPSSAGSRDSQLPAALSLNVEMNSYASLLTPAASGAVDVSQWPSLFGNLSSGLNLGIPFSAPCFTQLESVITIPTLNKTLCDIVKDTYVDECKC
jgi:hypothetical protein